LSFKQHLRAVPWLDKLVDLLVVILGISIAFGINNWADSRKNERKKEQYLVNLSNDLRVDSVALIKHQQGLENLRDAIDTLQALTYRRDLSKADTIAKVIMKLGSAGFFTPEDYTYRALQQTGDFSLLSADSLLLAVAKLYDIYGKLQLFEDLYKTVQFDYVIPYNFNYNYYTGEMLDPEMYFQPKMSEVLGGLDSNTYARLNMTIRAQEQLATIRRLINEELNW
jgi:hypothetical protein